MRKAPKVFVCSSFASRLKGLFSRRARKGAYIVLVPCRAVHTYGMGEPIDVAFADECGRVLDSCRNVGGARRLRCEGAHMVAERVACGKAWFERGDSLFVQFPELSERRAR